MASRAKTPPSPSGKSKKSAAPAPKSAGKSVAPAKSAKPVKSPPPKKTTQKLSKPALTKPETAKRGKKEAVPEPKLTPVAAKAASTKRVIAKADDSRVQNELEKKKKPGKKAIEVEPEIEEVEIVAGVEDDEEEFDEDEVMFDPSSMDRDDDEEDDEDGPPRPRKAKAPVTKKPARARKRSATEEFLEEDMEEIEEVEDPEVLDDLDPFASTIILDPDLPGPPPVPLAATTAAPLPPRPKRLAPRMQVCVDCGQQYGWLSIEKVCFNCLKKRVAQRKKDEDYSGYGGSDDSGGDDDY